MAFKFVPQFSFIASIQLGPQTVVTFTENCDFSPGEIVSFRISPPSGTMELNNQQATVLSMTADTITVGIDSTYFTPFVFNPINNLAFPAMVVPSASGILPGSMPATVSLRDAFDNIPTR